ncbi:hypothetical protein D3D03_08360 [Exiguobacterium sp. RIT452]|uniref:hypothetical protein n=1 Tax=Exiguobacterium sp. RIT452 TaxID=2315552 RepID=UPI000E70E8BF|nr:hypothetical protein [Exiguobacterium sp. RIT452]RJP00795.1 hypothetical protein D3D03_08360 [Exiguobacterium sp. RIT452]
MSNRYEQSLKEQAARIRRELAGEKETKPVERPKKEEREDRFVLTDVPSPIYGFQRPKKQRSIQEEGISDESEVEVSSELKEEKTEESLVDATDETNETSEIETMEQTDSTEADAGLVPTTDSDLLVPEPIIEQVPEERVEEMQPEIVHVVATEENEVRVEEATDETNETSEIETMEQTDSTEADAGLVPTTDSGLLVPEPVIEQVPENRVEEMQPEIVHVAAAEENELRLEEDRESEPVFQTTDENAANVSLTTIEETPEKPAEETVISQAEQVSIKKPVGPPVNVVMTTKDLMAMYRARREQNNLHGKK